MIDSDVEVNDPEVVMIRNREGDNLIDEIEEESKQSGVKRKRVRIDAPISNPEANGTLTITVHLITTTQTGEQLTKSRKNIIITIEDAGYCIDNIDRVDASNNVLRPLISARNVHGLVVNYFGQGAADTLEKIKEAHDPYLSSKLKINTNPHYLV